MVISSEALELIRKDLTLSPVYGIPYTEKVVKEMPRSDLPVDDVMVGLQTTTVLDKGIDLRNDGDTNATDMVQVLEGVEEYSQYTDGEALTHGGRGCGSI